MFKKLSRLSKFFNYHFHILFAFTLISNFYEFQAMRQPGRPVPQKVPSRALQQQQAQLQQNKGLDKFISSSLFKNFDEFYETCFRELTLPLNAPEKDQNQTVLTIEEFINLSNLFFSIKKSEHLSRANLWVGNNNPQELIGLTGNENELEDIILPGQLFVERVDVKANDELIVHADIHGDAKSLLYGLKRFQEMGYLDKDDAFKIKKPNVKFVFLGDYTDRGLYNLEVLYTLLRFWVHNPERVFLPRGNHEDLEINNAYGFIGQVGQVWNKFNKGDIFNGNTMVFFKKYINKIYQYLPLSLYICFDEAGPGERNAIVACHGGPDFKFSPKELFNNSSKRFTIFNNDLEADFNTSIKQNYPNNRRVIDGLNNIERLRSEDMSNYWSLWLDYTIAFNKDKGYGPPFFYDKRRGAEINNEVNKLILELQSKGSSVKVRAVIRGHQQSRDSNSDMMKKILQLDSANDLPEYKGVARLWLEETPKGKNTRGLWDNAVFTFNISPIDSYTKPFGGRFNFDTWGTLTIGDKFENCILSVQRFTLEEQQNAESAVRSKPKEPTFKNVKTENLVDSLRELSTTISALSSVK